MKEKVVCFFKDHFKKNPLSYLGWLGLFGIFGLMYAPIMIPFLICFVFFSYRNVIADELFWENVRRSGTRAFVSSLIFDVVICVFAYGRGLVLSARLGDEVFRPIVEGDRVTVWMYSYAQTVFIFLAFFASMLLMMLVFSISMMRVRRREKRSLENQDKDFQEV